MAQTKVKLVSNGVITVDNLHTNHGITTDHIGEGSVLYYTDARVQSFLTTNNYITNSDVANLETLTSLSLAANTLSYVDEAGNTTNLDLSLYLDDTNLARLVSGSLDGQTGIATFTRDDASTFTIDFSSLTPSETDPVFTASAASGITSTNITNWNTAYGWGDHSTAGYLTSFTESDPTVPSHVKSITTTNVSNWDTAYGWGNHASAGYLISVPDPLNKFSTSAWAGGGGYDGYTFVGGNTRFGFSSTTGVVDLYIDGNFYATDSSHLVWHAGNDGSGSGLDADTVDGLHVGNSTNNIAYLGNTRNLIINNPESYSGEIRLGAAWDRGGVYGSNHFTVATGGGKNIYFVINDAVYGTLNTDYFSHTSDIRTPIFYDSNDTGYYVDPNGSSKLNMLNVANAPAGRTLSLGSDDTSRVFNDTLRNSLVINASYYPHLYINATAANNDNHGAVISMTGTLTAGGYRRWGMGIPNRNPAALSWGYYDNNSNPHYSVGGTLGYTTTGSKMWLDTGGTLQTTGSMRSPIFYDSNNTGYYVDLAGGSQLNTLYVDDKIIFNGSVSINDSRGIYFDGSVSNNRYAIYREPGSWSHPYPDLVIGFHTGVKIGGHKNYDGTRFYNDDPANGSLIASIGDGDDNLRGYYDIIAYASDKRLKKDIQPIEKALDKVMSLNGFTYNWNDVGQKYGWEPPKEREAGVFAQEVQKVLPEAVRTAPFDQDHDVEGNMCSKSGENFLTVKYEKIVPLLIEATKEQQTIIEDLKQQIEELKSLINK
jgi:hypothetical protein